MEKELQIRSVIDAAKDAIISVNDKGKITSWNKGAEIIFGYTEEEATGQLVTLLMPEKFRALHHESFGRYLATGETKIIGKTVELEGLRKDGSVFPLELLLGTWKVGEEIFFSGIARDITERKRIEEELHKVNTLLQTVTETTTDLIFVKDRENRLLFANPATLLVIGKRADEAIGKSEFEWHHDMEQAAALRATDLRIMESGKTESLEEIFTGPEGTRIFLSTKSPMRDEKGAVIGLIGLARDITGRKQAENALKESEMWLQKLFESAPDAILVVNRKGRITRVNAVTEKMFGYSRDELVGKPIDILIPEKFREIHTSYRVEYNEKQRLRPMGVGRDVYAIRKNGITFPVSVTLNPISEDKTGDIIAIARDITEHKQAEMKISQSLVEKEALLKEIHHRVKNNMQVISSLLSLQSGYITDPQALGIFEECKQRVQTMALIHEKLYRTQNLSKIDFAEYINDLATSIFATYSVNTEAVILKIDADHAFLKIHSAIPCSLIINELVTNSIKYAFPNGEKGEIRIGFHIESNDRHILTVGDNGVGLPANFDIENAETLGLRLVNILVNQLEGDLEMSNKNGTEFKIGFQRTDKK
jgi:PAS domain S-box-containing protein